MIILYKILLYVLLILVFPFLPFLWLFSKKRRANLLQRFGFKTGFAKSASNKKRIWIHALSVGEIVSAVPFVQTLKKQHPQIEIILTASTKTGFDMASKLLYKGSGQQKIQRVDQLGYFPFDIGYAVNRLYCKIKPDAVVIVETDLWPNFLYEMKKNNIPVVLINARMSNRSLRGYLFFKRFSSLFFSSLSVIMAQSYADKDRFEALGIDKDRIIVTGNIKFDQPRPEMSINDINAMKKRFSIKSDAPVIIGGSTHPGEEKVLLSVYKKLREKFSDLVLILAPRDPERAHDLKSNCLSLGMPARRFSGVDETLLDEPAGVLLVDQMGVLARLYAVCDVAFIGGSMVKKGGHNPLEAACFSKPIVFGTDMSDFLAIATLLKDHGGAYQVETQDELARRLLTLLEDRQLRKYMGRESFGVFSTHCGAVQNIITQMERLNIV